MGGFRDSKIRGAPRIVTAVRGVLDVGTGRFDVEIKDVSATGACVEGAHDAAPGTTGSLAIQGRRSATLPVTVVRTGARVGLRFGPLSAEEADGFRAFFVPLIPALQPEPVSLSTGPLSLSSANLQTTTLYDCIGVDPLCSGDVLHERMFEIDEAVARAISTSEQRSLRFARLVQVQRALRALRPVWTEARARARYDFRYGIIRASERAERAAMELGLAVEELREIWQSVYPDEVATAAALLEEAQRSPEVAGSLRGEARRLDPFHPTFGDADVSARHAPAPASRGVRGDLADMGVMEIVQAIAAGRRDAEVQLRQGERTIGLLAFRGGTVVGAFTGATRGEEAFYTLASVERGEFTIRYNPPRPQVCHMQAMAQGLLLETVRRQDDAARGVGAADQGLGAVPNELVIPEPALERAPSAKEQARLEHAHEEVARLKEVVQESESLAHAAREEAEEARAAARKEAQRLRRRDSFATFASAVFGVLLGAVASLAYYSTTLDERAYRTRFLDANEQILSGQLEAGTAALEVLAEEYPEHHEVQRQLGDAYARARKRSESLAAYHRYVARAADPEDKARVQRIIDDAAN